VIGREVVRGKVGRLVWGYYPAASIEGYTVARQRDGTWHLRATLVESNSFNLAQGQAQGRLVFVAPIKVKDKPREWRWPVQRIETGSALGPREIVASLGELLP
jgi:hypothetical protein